MKIVIWLLVLGALGGGGYYWYSKAFATTERVYKTAPVKRGALTSTIAATGTVEPEEVVDIGAQVAGEILSFGTDKSGKLIDYGSIVEANTVLAKIDAALYDADLAAAKAQVDIDLAAVNKSKADVDTAKAKLDQSKSDLDTLKAKVSQSLTDLDMFKAKLDQSKSDVDQFQAKFEQAERDWIRAQKIGPSDALSQEAYDTYRGTFEAARAALASGKSIVIQTQFSISSQNSVIEQAKASVTSQVAVIAQNQAAVLSSEALIKQAEGTVAHDQAAVMRARQNVDYCTIKSPVKGVIIDRRVNIGETVVSSLNAPSLFLLAKDLNKMQVWASMNEADVGNVHPGQLVKFTVDAHPNMVFEGTVLKIRLNATMTQNVVTYTIEVETDNSNGKLLPYMTANSTFEVTHREDVLMVPNAALRFTAQKDEIAPESAEESGHASPEETSAAAKPDNTESPENATKPDNTKKPDAAAKQHKGDGSGHGAHARVWVMDGKHLKAIRVRTGITDGVNTEIVKSDELKEEMQVVTGRQSTSAVDTGATTNPFQPTNPFGRRTSSTQTTQSR